MRIRATALGLMIAGAVSLGISACGEESRRSEAPASDPASELEYRTDWDHSANVRPVKDRLEGLPGVVGPVDPNYEVGGEIFPGSIGFTVTVRPDATAAQVQAVIVESLTAFRRQFAGDSGDLSVLRGKDEVEVHVDNDEVDLDAIGEVVSFGFDARESGERVLVYVEGLRQHEGNADLESRVEFTLPSDSDRGDVLPRVDRFAQALVPPHTDVLVRAADQSALSGFDGLPTPTDRSIWAALDAGPHRAAYTVDFGPLNVGPGDSRAAMVLIALNNDRGLPPAERERRRFDFMTAHLDTLIEESPNFRYYVNRGSAAVLQIASSFDCASAGTGWEGPVMDYYREHHPKCAEG